MVFIEVKHAMELTIPSANKKVYIPSEALREHDGETYVLFKPNRMTSLRTILLSKCGEEEQAYGAKKCSFLAT